MATDSSKPMSPTAAVARHLEWLEFALAAARDEEARRKGRLNKATSKNRDKRTVRLAEVSAEVVELAALVTGIKSLRGQGAAPARKPRATSTKATPKAATSRSPAATATKPRPATASKPRATTARKTTRAGSKPATTRTRKPRPATRKSPTGTAAATAPTGPTV